MRRNSLQIQSFRGSQMICTQKECTPMNVVHLLLTGQPGGIEMLAYNIAQHSQNKNIMYFIFRGGSVADDMVASGIPVVIADTPRYFWKEKIAAFIQYCRTEKIDVVINHMYSPVACAYICALKNAIPSIKILGYMHSDVRDIVRGFKGQFLYRPLVRAMQQRCDKVIAISEFVKSAGMEAYGLPAQKIEVVYNAIDIHKFAPANTGNADGCMNLIFVGRLVREKGVHLFLEALAQLPEHICVHATIVGYGAEYDNLVKQASDLQLGAKVDFLGKRTDVPQLVRGADYFVHPAICQEGFGITIIEAMACGKPCIASIGGAIPEIIDETNGFLFKLGSVPDLAAKITQAYQAYNTQDYQIMSSAARAKAECFDIEDMVHHLEQLY